MNPETGNFHKLSINAEIAERMEAKASALDKLYKDRKEKTRGTQEKFFPIDGRMADLALAVDKYNVPASWPIFTVGEIHPIVLKDGTIDYCRIKEITKKDLIVELPDDRGHIQVGTEVLVAHPQNPSGRKFKFRFRKVSGFAPDFIYHLRPMVGTPRNYIK